MLPFRNTAGVVTRTKAMLHADGVHSRALVLPDGSHVKNVVVVTRPSDPALMHEDWPTKYMEIYLRAGGAVSGILLTDKWANKVADPGAIIMEVAAAHALWNAVHGTSHAVHFEPDATRYDPKLLKGGSIIGSSAEAAVVKDMLRALAGSEYGALRFFVALDANPGAQLAMGTWQKEWCTLELRSQRQIVLIGLGKEEYEDSQGGGAPQGVVAGELGPDVATGKCFPMMGYNDCNRVMISFPLAREMEVIEAIEACTKQALEGHPILSSGVKVSLVKPSMAEQAYTGPTHRGEVRELNGGGGAAMRERLDELIEQIAASEQTAEVERLNAEAERLRATQASAEAARAAEHNAGELGRYGAEVQRLGAETSELSQRLATSEQGRIVAEAAARREAGLASGRHTESQAAQSEARLSAAAMELAQREMAAMQTQMAQMIATAVGQPTLQAAQARAAITMVGQADGAGAAEIDEGDEL